MKATELMRFQLKSSLIRPLQGVVVILITHPNIHLYSSSEPILTGFCLHACILGTSFQMFCYLTTDGFPLLENSLDICASIDLRCSVDTIFSVL